MRKCSQLESLIDIDADASNRASLLPEGSKMLEQANLQSRSSAVLKGNHRRLLSQATTRSLPTSPSLSATRSPALHASIPTSVPASNDLKGQKLQAIRVPLIHLLAIRPVSARFLSQKIACTESECREVLQKVGQQHSLDASKYDLSKQAYKELDVWTFNYQSEEDRQSAIDRAISAFDRQRVGKEDKLWQMLLPQGERGKGKSLSRLNLQAGQAKKAMTPRINVEDADDGSTAKKTNNGGPHKNNRLAPRNAEPTARSQSQDRYKKASVTEKEAQSRRILGTAPKKAIASNRVNKPAGAAVKKAAIQNAVAPGKVKSSEYVHESDDDDSDEESFPPKKPTAKSASTAAAKSSGISSAKQQSAVSKTSGRNPDEVSPNIARKGVAMKKLPSAGSGSESKATVAESSQESVPMKKSQSRQRNTSSPHKPSPLGSSPPANASDMDLDVRSPPLSSASSTPLIAQSQRAKAPNGLTSVAGQTRTPSATPLKRKAHDLDPDIHNHGGLTNGTGNAVKRPKTSPMSPPTSDSSTGGKKNTSQMTGHDTTFDLAKQFKRCYEKYFKVDRELRAMAHPPPEKVTELIQMRERLVQMKQEIGQGQGLITS